MEPDAKVTWTMYPQDTVREVFGTYVACSVVYNALLFEPGVRDVRLEPLERKEGKEEQS